MSKVISRLLWFCFTALCNSGLVNKIYATFSTNENQNQSYLARKRFPALVAGCMHLLRDLIGPLYCLRLLWLVGVITLVLRHWIGYRWKVMKVLLNATYAWTERQAMPWESFIGAPIIFSVSAVNFTIRMFISLQVIWKEIKSRISNPTRSRINNCWKLCKYCSSLCLCCWFLRDFINFSFCLFSSQDNKTKQVTYIEDRDIWRTSITNVPVSICTRRPEASNSSFRWISVRKALERFSIEYRKTKT